MICGFKLSQGRISGVQPFYFREKIDVMPASMGKGAGFDCGPHLFDYLT
jgi:hypothetical protein